MFTVFIFGCPNKQVDADGVRLHVQLELVDVRRRRRLGLLARWETVLLLLVLFLLALARLVIPGLELVLPGDKEVFYKRLDVLDEVGRKI